MANYAPVAVVVMISLLPSLFALLAVPRAASDTEFLIASARQSLSQNDTDTAFTLLVQAHNTNANAPGLMPTFEDLFRSRIRLHDNAIDRMGLGSLYLEREEFSGAAKEFQAALNGELDDASRERAASSLFRARAAICDWRSNAEDSAALVETVRSSLASNRVPSVHPYEALMWPCLSIQDAGQIAAQYGHRAIVSVDANWPPLSVHATDTTDISCASPRESTRKVRIGYLSNDFTGKHPLGFLMQDVFQFHNSTKFDVYIYSLMEYDESPEIEKIRRSATGEWRELLGSAQDSAKIIRADDLDVLVDLTVYNGPSLEAEILAHRVAAVQMSHMGFPATSGAPLIDYLICDEFTVPPSLRQFYSECFFVMPHSWFANSHRYLPASNDNEQMHSREQHGLPENGFIFCGHHRSDKIDPITFRSWLRALHYVPNSYLWIITAGEEMERNLQTIAQNEFGLESDRLIFCNKVPREDHLHRLRLADLFLDTPAYNAHTTGCDSLIVGVPMVSLLRTSPAPKGEVETEKMASRVGAGFLRSLDLDELIAPSMPHYQYIMIKCATDHEWFMKITERLKKNRHVSPLFDTERWVRNFEIGLADVVSNEEANGGDFSDVYIVEKC